MDTITSNSIEKNNINISSNKNKKLQTLIPRLEMPFSHLRFE